jgi:hypothetical protein
MAKLRAEASGCYSWSNGPGDRYAPHMHSYEKVLYCVDGSITFVLESDGALGCGRRQRLHMHRRAALTRLAQA